MKNLEEDAWNAFYTGYKDRLMGYHVNLASGNLNIASENCQATLLRIVKNIKCFNSETEFWKWLCCLSRSVAIDSGRKFSVLRKLREKFSLHQEIKSDPAQDMKALSENIEEFLENLDPADRVIIVSKFWHGLKNQEIADETGSSLKSVEAKITRINSQAREWFSKNG